jgi:ABC-2 type transport system ATP-binding protein
MGDMCQRGKSVFFSTHVLEVAEKICDRIGIIHKGRIIAEGTMADLRTKAGREESLEKIFLEVTGV